MIEKKGVFTAVLLAGALLFLVPLAATAEEPLMTQDQTRLEQQIRQDTGMSQGEVQAFRNELQMAVKAAGETDQVRSMVRTAHGEGCEGECIATALRLMVWAMDEGISGGEAQAMIQSEIRSCVRTRSQTGMTETEMCQLLQNRFEIRMTNRLRSGNPAGTNKVKADGSTGESTGGPRGSGGGEKR